LLRFLNHPRETHRGAQFPRLRSNLLREFDRVAKIGFGCIKVPLKHLLNMDPPEHAEYRSIVSSSFTPRGVSGLEPEIENITRKVLDDVADRTEVRLRDRHLVQGDRTRPSL
jgi:cytochrome P450